MKKNYIITLIALSTIFITMASANEGKLYFDENKNSYVIVPPVKQVVDKNTTKS